MSRPFVWTLIAACIGNFLAASDGRSASPEIAQTAASIDRVLANEVGLENPAPAADDATFLRRVFLDLIGVAPTPDDVLAFSFDSNERKREKIVDRLLADPAFGENWARYWRDVIMYRRTEPRSLMASEALTGFLANQLNQNVSWDRVATAFITAAGDVRAEGQTALIVAQAGKPEDVVAEISRIFLGIQIQCAQCHDHPTDRWEREQFHQLAAFFPRVAVRSKRGGDTRSFEVVAHDRLPRRRRNGNNRYVGTLEHFMPDLEDPSSPGSRIRPVFFLTGAELEFGATDAQRRESLARWITSTENPWFAKALVNRVWSELVGEGFHEPVDDLGPDRDGSAPNTLALLADGFSRSGYDIKWLYRAIMATDAYGRASRGRRSFDEIPFQANCPQRLRADQLYDALVNALGLSNRGGNAGRGNGGYRARGPRAAFGLAFGFDPSEPREEIKSSIQQALALMNSPFVNQGINARRENSLKSLLREYADDRDAVTEMYLRTLSRGPSDGELRTCLSYLRRVGHRAEGFEDLMWALINSTEFLHR